MRKNNKLEPRMFIAPVIVVIIFVIVYFSVWSGIRNRHVETVIITAEETGEETEIEDGFNTDTLVTDYIYLAEAVTEAETEKADAPDSADYTVAMLNRKGNPVYTVQYLDNDIYITDGSGTYLATGDKIESIPEIFITGSQAAFEDAGIVYGAYITFPDEEDEALPDAVAEKIGEALGCAGLESGSRQNFREYGRYTITLTDDAGTEAARLFVYDKSVWLLDLRVNTAEYKKLTGMEDCIGWIDAFYCANDEE